MTQAGDGLAREIIDKARAAMEERGLDALLVTSPDNVAYTSGASPPSHRTVRSRLAACVLPAEGDTELVAVSLEAGVVRTQSRLDRLTLYQEFEQDPVDVVAASLLDRGLGEARIGIEETHLSLAEGRRLKERVPRARLGRVDEILAELRAVKTPGELERIRTIAEVAQRVALECVAESSAGMTERELGQLISERYATGGGDRLTMLVVGSGPRSAEVNAPPTDRTLEPGDLVRLDVIGTRSHYYSDVARTAAVGEPTDEQVRVYGLLADVHERVLSALRPGMSTSSVYETYRGAMDSAGLPAYHFVGHGLGVSLHEEPFCRAGASVRLREGMVLCIEPLVLIDGRYGIQIEDEILITADGCEPLTRDGGLLRIQS